jgi:hypothetical protein
VSQWTLCFLSWLATMMSPLNVNMLCCALLCFMRSAEDALAGIRTLRSLLLRNTESHQSSRESCPVHEPALPCPSHGYLPVPSGTQGTSQAGEPVCCCIIPFCARRKLRVSLLFYYFFFLNPFPPFCYGLMLTRFRLLLKVQTSNLSTLVCLSYPPRPEP